jgi:uncharacterized protein YyaL (SSP411 family)
MEFKKATVEWVSSYEDALNRSREEKKPILLDFFKDG